MATKKQIVVKRIEPVPFDPNAPRGVIPVKYITEKEFRKLYPCAPGRGKR